MKRAYVDTNVIVRFLTGDPPEMAEKVRSLFKAVDQSEISLIIEDLVVAESVWVLQSFYGYSPQEIAKVLQELISHKGLKVKDKPGMLLALNLYANKNIDFADAIVAIHTAQEGIKEIYSFDNEFDRLPGIKRRLPGE